MNETQETPTQQASSEETQPVERGKVIPIRRQRYNPKSMLTYLNEEIVSDAYLHDKYLNFYRQHLFFEEVSAGAKHHHWWKGGLKDHCEEMCGFLLDLHTLYKGDFPQVSREDLVIGVYLHDFAKIWSYRYITQEEREKNPKKFHEKQVFTYQEGATDILDPETLTLLELAKFFIVPTTMQASALRFAEGGFSSAHFGFSRPTGTSNTVYKRNALAVLISMADSYSSQVLGKSLV